MNIKVKIGNRIRQLRQEKHLSQEAFADLCELTEPIFQVLKKASEMFPLLILKKLLML